MGSALVRIGRRRGTIGETVRLGRESRGLTREDLALKLGCTQQDVRRMEEDREEIPTATLKRIALTLYYPIGFFHRSLIKNERGIAHIRGDGVEQCDRCAYVAEYLCDFPLGEKTCDLKLCEKHAVIQNESADIHFCPQHAIIAGGYAKQEVPTLDA